MISNHLSILCDRLMVQELDFKYSAMLFCEQQQ